MLCCWIPLRPLAFYTFFIAAPLLSSEGQGNHRDSTRDYGAAAQHNIAIIYIHIVILAENWWILIGIIVYQDRIIFGWSLQFYYILDQKINCDHVFFVCNLNKKFLTIYLIPFHLVFYGKTWYILGLNWNNHRLLIILLKVIKEQLSDCQCPKKVICHFSAMLWYYTHNTVQYIVYLSI